MSFKMKFRWNFAANDNYLEFVELSGARCRKGFLCYVVEIDDKYNTPRGRRGRHSKLRIRGEGNLSFQKNIRTMMSHHMARKPSVIKQVSLKRYKLCADASHGHVRSETLNI